MDEVGGLLREIWERATTPQPVPDPPVVLLLALAALVLVATPAGYRLVRHVVTLVHEAGHALTALLVGRRLSGIRLHSDTSGLTVSRGRPRGPGMVLTLLAGYVAPSLLGLGGAALLSAGRITLLLWTAIVLLFAVLVMIRNLYGLLAVLATSAAVFAVSWYADASVQAAFAYAAVWFLLVGGVRPVGELQRLRWRGRSADSDADQLARVTGVPGLAWVVLFGLVNLTALVAGCLLLLPLEVPLPR